MEQELVAGALFTEDKKHRFRLWRNWNSSLPKVLFIMLNPSTADVSKNDRTVARLIKFAKAFNYGGFYVGNLYSLRTPYPAELFRKTYSERLLHENTDHILSMAKECEAVIFAWGNFGNIDGEDNKWIDIFPNAQCFSLSNTGKPKHPLYLNSQSGLFNYKVLSSYRQKRYSSFKKKK